MKTPVPILDPIFEEPQDGAEVTGAMVWLTPYDAGVILRDMNFERQRDADPHHIGMLADMFTNGEWAPGSQITFAVDEFGKPQLVDGQHRLRAAVKADWQGLWQARVVWGERQVATSVYTFLDAYQKKRPAGVIGRAVGFNGLKDRMLGAIVAAARYQNQWSTDYTKPSGCSVPPVRDNIARAKDRLPYFIEAEEILEAGTTSSAAKRKLVGAMALAVMVETLACKENEQAREFWTAVATNGDGVAGELRDGLIEGKSVKAGMYFVPRLAAAAWNQRDAAKLKREYRKDIAVEATMLVIPT